MRVAIKILFAFTLAVMVISLLDGSGTVPELGMAYLNNAAADTGALNAVAAIILNYRVYDSMLETLMLLISVSAVIDLSWRKDRE